MTLAAGTRLGPYEILAPLGAGGMGEVYRARDTRLGRDVAVKVLSDEIAGDPRALARFQTEAKAVAALSHPNIMALHDVGEASGIHFAVMELLDGETLRATLGRGPLPVRRALEIAGQLADGLAAAHEKGIIHRDIKPENVVVLKDGHAKLLDFGLARQGLLPSDPAFTNSPTGDVLTQKGAIVGTVAYMSPEQARGLPTDHRSDQFSLGIVLYEMLTGRRPFQGASTVEMLTAIIREEPEPLEARAPKVPAPVRWHVERLLSKDPHGRYEATRDLASELATIRAHLSTMAGGHASVGAPRPRSTRLALAGLVVASLAGALVAWLLKPVPQTTLVAIRPLTQSGRDAEPAASPDGRTIAFSSDRDGTSRIWLKQLGTGDEVALTPGPDHSPRFSWDGTQVLFLRDRKPGRGGQDLYRIPVLGGEPRRIVTDANDADWSPDGRKVVFTRQTDTPQGTVGTVFGVDVEGGEPREIARFDGRNVAAPRFYSDGRIIVVRSAGETIGGLRFELVEAGGAWTRSLEPPPSLGDISSAAWTASGREIVYSQNLLIRYGSSQIVRQDVRSGHARALLWAPFETGTLDVLGSGVIVADATTRHQNLLEVPIPPSDRERRWLTHGTSVDRQPVFSPDGEWLAFTSTRSGNTEIWEVSLSTGAVRRLTEDAAEDWDPGFTRDGRLIWSSGRSGHLEIWIAEADGNSPHRVTDDGVDAENPVATPDGWIVYYSRNGKKRGLWKIRSDGSNATQLVPIANFGPNVPEVSPDGRWLAYTDEGRGTHAVMLRVARVSDGQVLRFSIRIPVPRLTEPLIGRVRWMPDGRALAFVGQNEHGVNGIYVQAFDPEGSDTSGTRRPLAGFDPDVETESFAISPDGSRLVIAGLETRFGIFTIEGLPGVLRSRQR